MYSIRGKFLYLGCFFNNEELLQKVDHLQRFELDKPVLTPHITIAFKPRTVDTKLFGQLITVNIIGYGYDQHNEGLRVELFSDSSDIQQLIDQTERPPHITLSVSENGKAVNTRHLDFNPIDAISITGVFGGYTYDGKVVLNN